MARYVNKRCIALALVAALTATPAAAAIPRAEIVLVKYSDNAFTIKVMRPGGKRHKLARGNYRYPAWSPDRSKVAFVEINPKNYDPRALWVVDRDGSNKRKLADLHGRWGVSSSYRVGFDWSPDSSRIVFSNRVDKESTYDLFVVTVESGEVTQLTSDAGTDEEEPDWSPTKDVVVYHQAPKTGGIPADTYDVYTVDIDSRETTQLTDDRWWEYSPMWSPDGKKVAFFSTRDDYHSEDGPYLWELYLIDADGSNERRLTEQATRKYDAVWAPDGSAIAYESRCDDDLCGNKYDDNIYVVDVSSGKLRAISKDGQRSEGASSWSPDSRWIAYEVHKRGGRELDLWAVRLKDGFVKDLSSGGEGGHQWAAGTPGGQNL